VWIIYKLAAAFGKEGKVSMKLKVKLALGVLLFFMACAAAVSSASAADFIFHNTLDDKVNIAVVYYDRNAGLWTTRGWWTVEGNDSRTVNIDNVDTSKDTYYTGINGNAVYLDKSTLSSDSLESWISDDTFRFNSTGKDRPAGKNVRTVRFYRCRYSKGAGDYVVRIDTKPEG
jgi:uncharacterized membrane protein